MNKIYRKKSKGFTLVEILSVMAIIGVLSSILLINSNTNIDQNAFTANVSSTTTSSSQLNPDLEGRIKLTTNAFKTYSPEGQNARMGAIAAAARLKANNGNDQAMINYIASYYDNRNPGTPGHWPNLSSVAWVVNKYSDKFTPAQLNNLKTRVKGLNNLVKSGTENHTLNYQVAGYLFAQQWPNETGWYGGRTSAQVMDATKSNLLKIMSSLYSKGYHEDLSTTYVATHLSPYFILYDNAKDPEVKKAADAAITFHISHMAANHFEGLVIPPFNRQNAPQFNKHNGASWNPVLQWTYWLYWGEVQNRVPVTSNFVRNQENRWFVHAALSDWRPSSAINSLAFGRTAPYELTSTKSNFEHFGQGGAGEYERYIYRDKLYAMGSGNMRFRPNGYYLDYNMSGLIYKSTDTFNYIDFHHDYWRSNNRIWTGASPFIQMAQHKNTSIVLFNIPDKDPWKDRGPENYRALRDQYFNNLIKEGMVRYPKSIDQKVESNGWIFLREGDVYIAIRPLKSYTVDGNYNNLMKKIPSNSEGSNMNSFVDAMAQFNVVRSSHAQTGFILDVGTKERFTSFESFQTAVRQNPLTVNWNNLSVSYKNVEGNTLTSTWRNPQPDYSNVPVSYGNNINAQVWIRPTFTVNGNNITLDSDFSSARAVIKSPSIRLVNRVLQLNTPNGNHTVDWSGLNPVISNNSPVPAPIPAPTPAPAPTPIPIPTPTPIRTYTIRYNANGATGGTIPSNQIKTQDIDLILSTNTGNLSRTGYTFVGWNTAANGSGTNYAAGARYNGNDNLLLYAQWTTINAASTNRGAISREVWNNIRGNVINNLTSDLRFPASPSSSELLTSFEAPTNWADNYGTRMRGFLHPQTTGNYTFWIASDNRSELWLSTDDKVANSRRIAQADRWTRSREWTKYPSQKSVSITLNAGQRYYIEAVHKEGGGADNLAVAWSGPGISGPVVIAGEYLSPWTGSNVGAVISSRVSTTTSTPTPVPTPNNIRTYIIRYNTNGATGGTIPSNQTKTQDIALTLATNTGNLSRTGYTFVGWNTAANGSGTNYAAGSRYTANEDLLLYAQWTTINAASTNRGTIRREVWTNIRGESISNLTSNSRFPASPSSTNFPTSFEAPTNWADNYGTRMRGFLHPQTTGNYTFWIASDDRSELWLSTDNKADNSRRIAEVTRWTRSREWTKYPSQKSVSITLNAGQSYYIEALHKEGGWGDNLAVAWSGPGISGPVVIAGEYLSPWIGSNGDNNVISSNSNNSNNIRTYTIRYNANGATGGTIPSNQTKTQDIALTLATNTGNLSKTGYRFVGWNTAANGSGTNYATGSRYTGNDNLLLYARWNPITTSITDTPSPSNTTDSRPIIECRLSRNTVSSSSPTVDITEIKVTNITNYKWRVGRGEMDRNTKDNPFKNTPIQSSQTLNYSTATFGTHSPFVEIEDSSGVKTSKSCGTVTNLGRSNVREVSQ
jgi:uncharacterized repeat protein (TIGR02543 family)/prepilin-type N-terminal cleavage/methylation domain-containing protein